MIPSILYHFHCKIKHMSDFPYMIRYEIPFEIFAGPHQCLFLLSCFFPCYFYYLAVRAPGLTCCWHLLPWCVCVCVRECVCVYAWSLCWVKRLYLFRSVWRMVTERGRHLVCLCKRRFKFWSLSCIYPGVRMLKAFVERHWRAAEGLPLNPVNGFGRCGNSSCSPLRH